MLYQLSYARVSAHLRPPWRPTDGTRISPVIRRDLTRWVALSGYALLSFGYFGVQLLVHHGGRTFMGIGIDPEIYTWSFAWWPHAILHGQNPIVTREIWAPNGVNLAWATSVPGLALLFTPLTLIVGPLASFNIASVLMPALAAWTAFLLCRYITRALWPSLVGGYIFGFSSYMLGQVQGHIFLTSVFLIPLVVLVVLRFFDADLSARGFAIRFGVLIACQLTFSTEVAFTLTLALAIALVLAFALVPARRSRITSLVGPLAAGYGVAAVLASPLLYYALTDFHHGPVNPVSPTNFTLDLLNLALPTNVTGFGHWWTDSLSQNFHGGGTESGGYLGIPVLLIIGWFAARRWRAPTARFLLAAGAVTTIAAFGSWLHVNGHRVITLPWEHIGYLPVFDNVLPVRLTLYLALTSAIIVAIWTASSSTPRWARVLLPTLAVLALVPNYYSSWTTRVDEPAFITHKLYKTCIRPGEKVAVFPFASHGHSMIWQTDADFWFRMSGGYVSPLPPRSFQSPPGPTGVGDIAVYGTVPDHEVAPLLQFLRVKKVDVMAVDAKESEIWPSLLKGIAKPHLVGGVLLYRFHGTSPCSV
jgi:hypothetical protein